MVMIISIENQSKNNHSAENLSTNTVKKTCISKDE